MIAVLASANSASPSAARRSRLPRGAAHFLRHSCFRSRSRCRAVVPVPPRPLVPVPPLPSGSGSGQRRVEEHIYILSRMRQQVCRVFGRIRRRFNSCVSSGRRNPNVVLAFLAIMLFCIAFTLVFFLCVDPAAPTAEAPRSTRAAALYFGHAVRCPIAIAAVVFTAFVCSCFRTRRRSTAAARTHTSSTRRCRRSASRMASAAGPHKESTRPGSVVRLCSSPSAPFPMRKPTTDSLPSSKPHPSLPLQCAELGIVAGLFGRRMTALRPAACWEAAPRWSRGSMGGCCTSPTSATRASSSSARPTPPGLRRASLRTRPCTARSSPACCRFVEAIHASFRCGDDLSTGPW